MLSEQVNSCQKTNPATTRTSTRLWGEQHQHYFSLCYVDRRSGTLIGKVTVICEQVTGDKKVEVEGERERGQGEGSQEGKPFRAGHAEPLAVNVAAAPVLVSSGKT